MTGVGALAALPQVVPRKTLLHRLLSLAAAPKKPASAPAPLSSVNTQAAALLDSYGSSILRCAYAYLHNMSDAEEILQETLLRFLQTAPVLESPAHEKAWLLRVAANLSKNALRYHALHSTDALSDTLAAQEQEDLSFVWSAVRELPAAQRAAIHLYYCEGYPVEEIARILQRKAATVRSDLHRGRLRLKKILKDAYDFE